MIINSKNFPTEYFMAFSDYDPTTHSSLWLPQGWLNGTLKRVLQSKVALELFDCPAAVDSQLFISSL